MKILIATDGSEYGLAAASKCCEIITLTEEDTVIKIISVMETLTPIEPFGASDEYFVLAQKAERQAAESSLEKTREMMLEKLGAANVEIETEAISGTPARTIVEEAEKWKADLVFVGSHGRGFWGRVLLGSVSDAVVRHAPCSVLVVRESKRGEKD